MKTPSHHQHQHQQRQQPQPSSLPQKSARPSAPASTPQSASVAAADSFAELESLLCDLLVEHEQLLTLARAQKTAMAAADSNGLSQCVHQQNIIVQRVAELEKRRLGLVARLSDQFPPTALMNVHRPDKPTLTWLAESFPAAVRDRVLRVAERLRDLLARIHREHLALREAAATLSTHMEAVIRQVTGRLSHAGTYGRRGTVETRVQVVSSLDLRS